MYTTFYGLAELPFELSPNPKYLLLTARHREALANLQYGISARKSLTLLIGEAGTGKTTLVHSALASEAVPGRPHRPSGQPDADARGVHRVSGALVRSVARGAGARRRRCWPSSSSELRRRQEQGVTTALVIDEAQCLSMGLLEEVRLLSNIETPGQKLLPLVLAGQPELADQLNLPSLVQLKQRVALRCTLGPARRGGDRGLRHGPA